MYCVENTQKISRKCRTQLGFHVTFLVIVLKVNGEKSRYFFASTHYFSAGRWGWEFLFSIRELNNQDLPHETKICRTWLVRTTIISAARVVWEREGTGIDINVTLWYESKVAVNLNIPIESGSPLKDPTPTCYLLVHPFANAIARTR